MQNEQEKTKINWSHNPKERAGLHHIDEHTEAPHVDLFAIPLALQHLWSWR